MEFGILNLDELVDLHQFTGVVGLFNCQGGGWCRETRSNKCASEYSKVVSSVTGPSDIEWKHGTNPIPVEGVQTFAMYLFREKKLMVAKPSDTVAISLEPFNFELITVSPVKYLAKKSIQFAPLGLVNMLNTGGAVQSLVLEENEKCVKIGVTGRGELRVFASERPVACKHNGGNATFGYEDKMVIVQVPWHAPSGLSVVEYHF